MTVYPSVINELYASGIRKCGDSTESDTSGAQAVYSKLGGMGRKVPPYQMTTELQHLKMEFELLGSSYPEMI